MLMERELVALKHIKNNMHEWALNRKRDFFYHKAYEESKIIAKHNHESDEDYSVDIVVTWVDGNDPVWLKERNKYMDSIENADNSKSRFREWGTFPYFFRAIEDNAPWVRHVYLVTYGHLPEWLNTNASKLKIVNHKDFIPKEYLPTFSSHTIEWNLWRIPGLSEHFVYFNDDVFIMNKLNKNDFFFNGYPRYTAIAQPIITYSRMAAHRHARFNNLGLMNSYFDIQKSIEKNPEKWFNVQYGKLIKYNKLAYEDGYISGMYYHHVGTPFRKTAIADFTDHFADRVHETCLNRFRTSDDIMHQAVQMWEIFNGTFEPIGPYYLGKFISPTKANIEETINLIRSPIRMLCINDHDQIPDTDFDEIKMMVINELDKKFPKKSSFEL